jgi:predicted ATP-dependent Lon-type protease
LLQPNFVKKKQRMKKVVSYTIGWDTTAKEGYLTAVDEDKESHAFGQLSQEEFRILYDLLKEDKVFIDNNHWFISGWENPKF